jgi:ribonuclease Z
MRPLFHPRLINGPFEDPALLISFDFERRAILFDLGEIYPLSARDVLKISHIFVTHTHIDHFAGFDRLLRICLGREKDLHLYGPAGFLSNVEGKLAGYTWNLVEQYGDSFSIRATEIHPDHRLTRCYPCRNRFLPEGETRVDPFNGILLEEPAFRVSSAILDHRIPCLAFSIQERFHVNIDKVALHRMGLSVGPWLRELKQALFRGEDPGSGFRVPPVGNTPAKGFLLGDLASRIAFITPGQKVTYIADAGCNEPNVQKMVSLASDSDHLFIEAAFLDEYRDMAGEKFHLTARQAGAIARKARVKQLTIFHFSPRYMGREQLLQEEAFSAFRPQPDLK